MEDDEPMTDSEKVIYERYQELEKEKEATDLLEEELFCHCQEA